MTDERRELILAVAAEKDAAVTRAEEALAQTRANRAAAVAGGQTDLSRFDQAEADWTAIVERLRTSAEAFRREARGEPSAVRVEPAPAN